MSDEIVVIQQPTSQLIIHGHGGIPGAEGPQGDVGLTGAQGPPGGPWYFGVSSPDGAIAANANDMFLNTVNGDVYQCNGGTSWTLEGNIKGADGADGADGANGSNGTRGSLWSSGAGVPSAANNSGDMYLRTATNIGDVYQGSGGTSWSNIGNIRGPAGANGADGADGDTTVYGATLTSTASYSTSLTTIAGLTISSLPAGTYIFEAELDWDTDINTTTSYRFNYSGTLTDSNFKHVRYTASAMAFTQDNAFNSTIATSSTSPQGVQCRGMFVASTSGNLSCQLVRAAGASGTAHKGCFIKVKKVA